MKGVLLLCQSAVTAMVVLTSSMGGSVLAQEVTACSETQSAERNRCFERAEGFRQQGMRHAISGENELAIINFSQAIMLDPDAQTYALRGVLRNQIGAFDDAVLDANRAIDLRSRNHTAWLAKGTAEFGSARFAQAGASLTQYLQLNPLDTESAVMAYIARRRAGDDEPNWLRDVTRFNDPNSWDALLVGYMLGERSEEVLQEAAGTEIEKCRLAFFVGQKLLLEAKQTAAQLRFQEAAITCSPINTWRAVAQSEFNRLSQ